MIIAYDAKRAFLNSRGLGNYSRDMIRLMRTYAPQNEYLLYSPKGDGAVTPQGLWKVAPALWRTFGIRTEADIYHGLSGELPYGLTSSPHAPKTVVTVHDAIFLRYPEYYSTTYRWLFTRKVQYACDTADCIIAISEQTKQDIIRFFHADERKIRVHYQGCSNIFRTYKSEISPRRDYILFVGSTEPRKNILNLIRALASAKIDLPLVALGGANKNDAEALALAQQLGVRLELRHGVPFEQFPALYYNAACLCYPSYFEGFGIPILEAMCVGTPVVTSTGSCFHEVGGEAARYADPANPEAIGAELQKVLTDNALRNAMIEQGFVQAALFTDEKVAKNLLAIYEELA